MLRRGKQNAGRGYSRDAWIKHHQGIVERVERQKKERESLNSENRNLEGTLESGGDKRSPTDVDSYETMNSTEEGIDRKADSQLKGTGTEEDNVHTKTSKVSENVSILDEGKKYRSRTTVQQSTTMDTTSDNTTGEGKTISITYTENEQVIDLDETKQQYKHSQMETDVCTENGNVPIRVRKPTSELDTLQKEKYRNQTDHNRTMEETRRSIQQRIAKLKNNEVPRAVMPSVQVKKELVDVVMTEVSTNGNTAEVSEEKFFGEEETNSEHSNRPGTTMRSGSTSDGSVGSMTDTSTESEGQLWDSDTSMGSVDDDVGPLTQGQSQRADNNVEIKSKLQTFQASEKQRKTLPSNKGDENTPLLPTTQPNETQDSWSSQDQSFEFVTNKQNNSQAKNNGETMNKSQDKSTNGEKLIEVLPTGTNPTLGAHTSSDDEWADIATKVRPSQKQNNFSSYRSTVNGKTNYPTSVRRSQFIQAKTLISTNTSGIDEDTINNRGIYLTDNKELISTPISIEFNIEAGTREFNMIRKCSVLLNAMSEIDRSIRVYSSTHKELLWETNGTLPENDKFRKFFGMREQHFRKGNSKVTLYCTVESLYPINKIKFTDPVKSLLYENNIWLKPDFYSTKIVSSPGFFTLLHPRLTNKEALAQHIHTSLHSTQVDEDEPLVQEWNKRHGENPDTGNSVPQFHIETTLKKWGQVQVEVLSIHCAIEDSKYAKYLFVSASTQGKFCQGVYVPTGVHLLEGKEVLTNLLVEHQNFVQTTTSFQIDGISAQEMEKKKDNQSTIREILSNATGVHQIEKTHQTIRRGQWVLVVERDRAKLLAQYIRNHVSQIYCNKQGTQPKLVTHQIENSIQGYRLQRTDSIGNTVGTYAEVLTRRFTASKNKQVHLGRTDKVSKDSHTDTYKETTHTETNKQTSRQFDSADELEHNGFPLTDTPEQHNSTLKRSVATGEQLQGSYSQDSGLPVEAYRNHSFTRDKKQSDTNQETIHQWQNNIETVEKTLQDKIERLASNNQKMLQELEKRIEEKVDSILETKIDDMSIVVGDRVTNRVLKAMGKMFKRRREVKEPEAPEKNTVTQDSPSGHFTALYQKPYCEDSNDPKKVVSTTTRMLTELDSIAKTNFTTADPPHDNLKGSVESVL